MIGDPFLNDFALGVLIFVILIFFYGIIAIHDIPAKIAAKRHHPHEDAIHAAGWVSLFTLHVIWPFLWIWAMTYRPDRGWGFSHGESPPAEPAANAIELDDLRTRVAELETTLKARTETVPAIAAADPKGLPKRQEPVLASTVEAELKNAKGKPKAKP
jgi:hypothetical protein